MCIQLSVDFLVHVIVSRNISVERLLGKNVFLRTGGISLVMSVTRNLVFYCYNLKSNMNCQTTHQSWGHFANIYDTSQTFDILGRVINQFHKVIL